MAGCFLCVRPREVVALSVAVVPVSLFGEPVGRVLWVFWMHCSIRFLKDIISR